MSYSLLDGYKTASQSNAPWALTFRPTLKAPVIANRIFDTLEHAQAYVDDDSSTATAIPGLILSVFNDADSKNNGAYRICQDNGGSLYLKPVGPEIPKKQHELIYADPNSNGELEFNTKQLMFEDGKVVDNEVDFEATKGTTEQGIEKFGMGSVVNDPDYPWVTKWCNSRLEPPSGSTTWWVYNDVTDSIDATYNDMAQCWIDQRKHPFIQNVVEIGFFEGNVNNDGIGIYLPYFWSDSTGSYVDVLQTDFGNRKKNGADRVTSAISFLRRKLSDDPNGSGGTIIKRLIIGDYTTTSNGYRTCLWQNEKFVPLKATGEKQTYFVKVQFIKKDGVITFNTSDPYLLSEREDKEKTKLIENRSLTIDLNNYTVELKNEKGDNYTFSIETTPLTYTDGVLSGSLLEAADNTNFSKQWSGGIDIKDVIDNIRDNAVYGFWQYSTPKGRIYNNYYVDADRVEYKNAILKTDDETVWQYIGSQWSKLDGVKPIDLFTGSRLSYNDKTGKLFYSNGKNIYELSKTVYYLPLSGGTMQNNAEITFNDEGGNVRTIVSGLGIEAESVKCKSSSSSWSVKTEALSTGLVTTYSEIVEGQTFTSTITPDRTINPKTGLPTILLTYSGGIAAEYVSTVNGVLETSDIRKKNIIGDIPLDKAYELIDKCSTVLYTLKDNESQKPQIGVIAQEVEEFFPEIVSTDADGFKSIDYSRLTVVLLRVLKDLIGKVSRLESLHEQIG